MRLSDAECGQRLAAARVLRLATTDASNTPHLVPAVFAARGNVLVSAVDHKPKRHQDLRRLRNIRENPRVCVLVDAYSDDWSRLWWVRGDGRAAILEGAARAEPLDRLAEKYPRYRERRPIGPVIEITVERWTGWASGDADSSG
ncbi:TIGR03668 family PPOX class F420-dependent oxidoreductase [Streptomyces sp. SBT349]|uniref:TIGR03668 family PPOX class F420-dependent oxidoreductase n=1 Tax=Streptomyces sp. SBT349 TaxID=1580539 RepID=UPI00066D43EE|nr:TIGR03668 family PPOX class F420-dependent oxidoreductase [Streptomyces sp. SBT349]